MTLGMGRDHSMHIIMFIMKNADRCWSLTLDHISIVAISIFLASLIGIPTGIIISHNKNKAQKIINIANIFMTIPSIALFGLMLPMLAIVGYGLGKVPAIIALVLYSQLPIIRNTYVGISNIPPELVEAANGLGMDRWTRLKEIEIPLAMPVIIAGLRNAAVMSIGIATIAAYIGAGGLGVLIQQGIARAYDEMILAGAILVALLAIFIDCGMSLLEKILTPKGLEITRNLET
jgi:osmoprotectant transport system permease protein